MDANKLRAEVFEKTGIKVDTTDPVFALVALNEAVLAGYAEQHAATLHASLEQLREQTRLLNDAGERTKRLLLQMGQAVEEPANAVPRPPATDAKPSSLPFPAMMLAGATALLSAILVGIVLMLLAPSRQPAPPASTTAMQPQAAAPALTPEQQQFMQDGEKFAKAWPKLDAKTQEKVQAAMRQ